MDKTVSQFLIFALIILALLFIVGGEYLPFRIFPILTTDAPIHLVERPTAIIDDDDISIIINNNYDHKHNQLLGVSNPLNLHTTTPKGNKTANSSNNDINSTNKADGSNKSSVGSAPLVGGPAAKVDPNVKNSVDGKKIKDLPASASDSSDNEQPGFGSSAPLGDIFSFPSNSSVGSSINSPQASSGGNTPSPIQTALYATPGSSTTNTPSISNDTSSSQTDTSGVTPDDGNATDSPSPIDNSSITTTYSSAYSDNVTVAPVVVSTYSPTTTNSPTTTYSAVTSSSKYTTYSSK
jgi:hypothetical protein